MPPAKKLKEKPKSPVQQELPPPIPTKPTTAAPLPPPLPPKPPYMTDGVEYFHLSKEMRAHMVTSPEPRDPSPPPLPPKSAFGHYKEVEPEPEPEPVEPEPEPEEVAEQEPQPARPVNPLDERPLPTRHRSYDERGITG